MIVPRNTRSSSFPSILGHPTLRILEQLLKSECSLSPFLKDADPSCMTHQHVEHDPRDFTRADSVLVQRRSESIGKATHRLWIEQRLEKAPQFLDFIRGDH
jgi:hypothetical protein